MDWDKTKQILQEAWEIKKRDTYLIASIAFDIKNNFGVQGLRDMSSDLSEEGVNALKYRTLNEYAKIYAGSVKLGIPEDVPFYMHREIIFSDNPKKWMKKIKDGASGYSVYKEIRGKKGKVFKCIECGYENVIS